ncbi:MAG: YebC/PmpR family DNA-binding transcriptional regulator, partial [Planctomycetota bacterium]
TSGCVNWIFSKKGLITVKAGDVDEDALMEIALSSGADDMENTGQVYEITCEVGAYEGLKNAIAAKEIPTEVAEISMVPQNHVSVADESTARKILNLMEEFDDHDDVQNVYANFDIPDEIVSKVS